tara:strand:- start:237 stop:1517 length:1281 start_codon:yes stop_codon:yes gene_type:complete
MSIFTCCEREDETKYLHTCECPYVALITSSESRDLSLCGHSEYGSTPSDPPKKYRVEVKTVLSGESNGIQTGYMCYSPFVNVDNQCFEIRDGVCYYYNSTYTDCGETQSTFCGGSSFTTCITGPRYERTASEVFITSSYQNTNYVDTETYDASTCQTTTVRTGVGTVTTPASGVIGDLCASPNFSSSLGSGWPITTTDVTPEFTDTKIARQTGSRTQRAYGAPDTFELTTAYQLVYSGSGCISRATLTGAGNQSRITGGLVNYALSAEDTEADALARSTLVEGNASNSSIGVRGASYNSSPFSWSIQSAKYALLFADLIVGKDYQSQGLPRASAEIGETYEEETNIPIPTFTATDTFHIIGGTLNVTPAEFKEQNFSLNPSSYSNLPAGDKVIDPTEDVAEADGYKNQVTTLSIGSEPNLNVEMVP